MEKFPDHVDAPLMSNGSLNGTSNGSVLRNPSPSSGYEYPNGNGDASERHPSHDRFMPMAARDNSHSAKWAAANRAAGGHRRQKSLSDAFRTIRTRSGSVSQNAHEIADALKAPVSPKLIALCVLWYASSALTNTSSKSILNAFDKPATLTLIQFAFVSSLCISLAWLATVFPVLRQKITALKHPIRKPTREVLQTTLPLAAFQIGGHLLSSTATSKIPVSLVHTIKGLSPLFTVLAYRFVYDIRYPRATYYSLIPLTLGVMLACSGKHQYGGQLLGVFEAFLATIIFVIQNIFSKKLFNEAAIVEAEGPASQPKKLDKLNLLCYSSGMAFLMTMPIWFWTEGIGLLGDFLTDGSLDLEEKPGSMDHGRLIVEFIFNGVFHFGQNILAFVLLSMVSPVTYSVASLIKRVFVIVMAILWFRSPTTPVQGVGIGLTFVGLYLYDRTSESNKADRKARMMSEGGTGTPLLPLNTSQAHQASAPTSLNINTNTGLFASPQSGASSAHPYTEGFAAGVNEDPKKTDDVAGGGPNGYAARGRARGQSNAGWLPPGTKQEDTWRTADSRVGAKV